MMKKRAKRAAQRRWRCHSVPSWIWAAGAASAVNGSPAASPFWRWRTHWTRCTGDSSAGYRAKGGRTGKGSSGRGSSVSHECSVSGRRPRRRAIPGRLLRRRDGSCPPGNPIVSNGWPERSVIGLPGCRALWALPPRAVAIEGAGLRVVPAPCPAQLTWQLGQPVASLMQAEPPGQRRRGFTGQWVGGLGTGQRTWKMRHLRYAVSGTPARTG